jgi:hypothetical protein
MPFSTTTVTVEPVVVSADGAVPDTEFHDDTVDPAGRFK